MGSLSQQISVSVCFVPWVDWLIVFFSFFVVFVCFGPLFWEGSSMYVVIFFGHGVIGLDMAVI